MPHIAFTSIHTPATQKAWHQSVFHRQTDYVIQIFIQRRILRVSPFSRKGNALEPLRSVEYLALQILVLSSITNSTHPRSVNE